MPQEPQITSHPSRPVGASESPFASAQSEPATDVRSALGDAIAQLEREGVPSAALAAELLLMHALQHDRAWIYAHPELQLDAGAREKYFSLIAQRAGGVPTQHLTGHQEFWGLDFEVTPDVLIPRPETEHVIEVALDRLGISADTDSTRRKAELQIADVGTGSGCIAVSLAHELRGAHIFATDISAAALEVARRNASRHEVASRIDFSECNLLDVMLGQSAATPHAGARQASHSSRRRSASESRHFDLIVSNPPYIGREESATLPREVREHEPESALLGGAVGTEMYAPLIAQAAMLLKPGGILVLELGHTSAQHVSDLLSGAEWTNVAITHDLAGIARVASAQRRTDI